MEKLIKQTGIEVLIRSVKKSAASKWLTPIVIYAYAFLYMYTGYDKLHNVAQFIKGSKRIPFFGQYAELIGWGIPILEILLAVFLVFSSGKTRRITLGVAVTLMGIFTLYLALMMGFIEQRLCHCGGVISSMGWTTHLIFNLIWLAAGIYAYRTLKVFTPLK